MLKSNGLHRPKIRLKKFSFSLKIVPAYISKKLPSQCWPKPLFVVLFNFSQKRPTFAFTDESGYTLGFRRKIAHNGLHAETGAFPPPATAQSCATSEITLYAAFVTLDSATLLYTYISRFSVNPHHQAEGENQAKLPLQLCPNRFSSRFSTSCTNGPRLLSRVKLGTHSAFGERSHTRAHTAKHGASPPSTTTLS